MQLKSKPVLLALIMVLGLSFHGISAEASGITIDEMLGGEESKTKESQTEESSGMSIEDTIGWSFDERKDTYYTQDDTQKDNGSVSDLMGNWSKENKPDTGAMKAGKSFTTNVVGLLISIGVVLLFACNFVITACDLLWMAVPPIRPLLYGNANGDATAYVHTSVMHDIASHKMMRGDVAGAMAAEAEGNYRDANWFGNKESLERAESKARGSMFSQRRFISSELAQLARLGQVNIVATTGSPETMAQGNVGTFNNKKDFLLKYFKARSVSMILLAVCVMLLLGSSIFTDFGLNVGQAILDWLMKLF